MDLRLDLALSTGSDPVRGSDERSLPLQEQTQESPFSNRIRDGEAKEGFVVGWPPVRSWRKQLCRHNRRGWRGQNSVYVKVKMEGVGITRKIDLSRLRSHRKLASKLISLFGKYEHTSFVEFGTAASSFHLW